MSSRNVVPGPLGDEVPEHLGGVHLTQPGPGVVAHDTVLGALEGPARRRRGTGRGRGHARHRIAGRLAAATALLTAFLVPLGIAGFSPAGATESELHFETWGRLVALNPVLRDLGPDAEGLIVNRMADPPAYAIAPIDRCYMLVGVVKAAGEGISGGAAVEQAIEGYFDELRRVAA